MVRAEDDPAVLPIRLRQRPGSVTRTRFAPAPTGHLHLGHVVNAIHVWGLARATGARVVLRVEDHDGQRSRREYERSILDDLEWLGLYPDEGTFAELRAGPSPYRQTDRHHRYERVAAQLDASSLTYWCQCSRAAIARVAPGSGHGESCYPGTCRDLGLEPALGRTLRFRVPATSVQFDDARSGVQVQRPALQCGDFALRDVRGNWTYQFAVVVDDLDQEIDLIIRGVDLLPSTGRQLLLARALGAVGTPAFVHHPLLYTSSGAKLSKSGGAAGIRERRAAGESAEQVLGCAAFLAGLTTAEQPVAAAELPLLFGC